VFLVFGRSPFGVAALRVSLRSWLRHRFAALQAANAKACFSLSLSQRISRKVRKEIRAKCAKKFAQSAQRNFTQSAQRISRKVRKEFRAKCVKNFTQSAQSILRKAASGPNFFSWLMLI
jgi:Fe2+ transport system protein B